MPINRIRPVKWLCPEYPRRALVWSLGALRFARLRPLCGERVQKFHNEVQSGRLLCLVNSARLWLRSRGRQQRGRGDNDGCGKGDRGACRTVDERHQRRHRLVGGRTGRERLGSGNQEARDNAIDGYLNDTDPARSEKYGFRSGQNPQLAWSWFRDYPVGFNGVPHVLFKTILDLDPNDPDPTLQRLPGFGSTSRQCRSDRGRLLDVRSHRA